MCPVVKEGRGAVPSPLSFSLTAEAWVGLFLSLPGALSPPQGCCFADLFFYMIFVTFILYTVNRTFRLIKAGCSPPPYSLPSPSQFINQTIKM